MSCEKKWKPERISRSLTRGIRRHGRSRTKSCQKRFACPQTRSTRTSPGFPKTDRLSPTALDPTKAQAPVWRKNFGSADTRHGRFRADWMPGAMQVCAWSRSAQRHDYLLLKASLRAERRVSKRWKAAVDAASTVLVRELLSVFHGEFTKF